jgi:hypothetical protein
VRMYLPIGAMHKNSLRREAPEVGAGKETIAVQNPSRYARVVNS